MFDHLDDPNPPRPTHLVVDRIAAEGALRLRRRRVAAGGAIVLAMTLGVVGIAVAGQLPGQDDSLVGTVGDQDDDPTTSSAPSTTTTTDPEVTSSTSTPTTDPTGSGTGPTTPAAGEGADTFVAVIRKPGADAAQVVLAGASTGEVVKVLAEYPLLNRPPLCCVTWSTDRRDVYYVVQAGDYGQGMVPDTIWHVTVDGGRPEQVTAGTNPSVSPDGTRLVLTRATDVVFYDLDTGEERPYGRAVDELLRDTAWVDDDTAAFTLQAPESALEAFTLDLDGALTRIGPPGGSPSGTSWEFVDLRPDGQLGVVETCCALDAGTFEGATSYVVVDPASSEVAGRTELPGRVIGAYSNPTGDQQLFLVPPPDSPGYGTAQRHAGDEIVDLGGTTEFIAIDW